VSAPTRLIVSEITAASGREAELETALRSVASASVSEAGCLGFDCSRDLNDPARFVLVEHWADLDAIKAHGASGHLAAFRKAIDGLIVRQNAVLHSVDKSRAL
jgi:quinol monooxygenase YgiN